MAKTPGLPTLINSIKNDPKLTPAEKKSLIEDARYFAKDGKLTPAEKQSVKDDQKTFGSPNNGATPTKPSPSPPPPPPLPSSPPPTAVRQPPISNSSNTSQVIDNTVIPSPTPITPATWNTKSTYSAPTGVKQANIDTIIFDPGLIDPDYLTQAFFDEFGGTELIKISRTDLIKGSEVQYSLIKNLPAISQNYNSYNIIDISAFQKLSEKNKINLYERNPSDPYFDYSGNLIIEIEEIKKDEYVEIEISFNGTISLIGEA